MNPTLRDDYSAYLEASDVIMPLSYEQWLEMALLEARSIINSMRGPMRVGR